jgi:hypothetical protein
MDFFDDKLKSLAAEGVKDQDIFDYLEAFKNNTHEIMQAMTATQIELNTPTLSMR